MKARWLSLMVFVALVAQISGVLRLPEADVALPVVIEEVPEAKDVIVLPEETITDAVVDDVPDFASIRDVRTKKDTFFQFMLPKIRDENRKISQQRNVIETYRNKVMSGANLAGGDRQRLKELFTQYKLDMPDTVTVEDIEALLNRADVVPASLVLAQAANESGWGTSRFATEANNYFGIWCFRAGCGVVPQHRSSGLNHEVASYDSVQDGVAAYMRNINTHRAYSDLRRIRGAQRDLSRQIAGKELAEGLHQYSERGEDYVREIQQMIRVNNLESFNKADKA